MQTSRQMFSSDFVYLLHAAVPAAVPDTISPEVEDDGADEDEDDVEDDNGVKEINFDD